MFVSVPVAGGQGAPAWCGLHLCWWSHQAGVPRTHQPPSSLVVQQHGCACLGGMQVLSHGVVACRHDADGAIISQGASA